VGAKDERGNGFLDKQIDLGFGLVACRKKNIVE
jgi:hypothetical protein